MARLTLRRYILNKHGAPELARDYLMWLQWISAQGSSLRVALHAIVEHKLLISTSFTGIDRNITDHSLPPLPYSTLVSVWDVPGEGPQPLAVYYDATKKDALQRHDEAISFYETNLGGKAVPITSDSQLAALSDTIPPEGDPDP